MTPDGNHLDKTILVVGIGCRRGCPLSELVDLLDSALDAAAMQRRQISALATSIHKHNEPAPKALAAQLGCELILLNDAALHSVGSRLSQVSPAAEQAFGLPSVAEASALAGADGLGRGVAQLVLTKRKSANATLAIAIAENK
jgi:cobalt-precorrin 5A hydrolase